MSAVAPFAICDAIILLPVYVESAKGLRLESIRLTHLEEHVGSLAPAHRRRAIAALRNFFAYAADEGSFKNPARLLSDRRTNKTLAELFTDAGLDTAFAQKLSYRQWLEAAVNGSSDIRVGRRLVLIPEAHWRRIARSFGRSIAQATTASELGDLLDEAFVGSANSAKMGLTLKKR